MKVLLHTKYEDANNRVWGNVFGVHYDIDVSTMKLQEEEVEYITLMTRDEILQKIEDGSEKFTPDGILAFKEFIILDHVKEFLDNAYKKN